MLFDSTHIWYMLISLIVSVGLILANFFVFKTQKKRDILLKVSAIATVILHFSSLYVDFFTYGTATIEETQLLPIYPCHVIMWTLLISALYRNKESKVFRVIAEFTFYIGMVGGIIGIMFNENYANTPSLYDWDILKGLLSHSTMLIGCACLLTNGHVKIRVRNVISVAIGLMLLLVDGYTVIGLYNHFGLTPPNCMYLLENPFPNLPWFNTALIGIVGVVIVFAITSIFEKFALEPKDRWYNKFRHHEEEEIEEKEA